MHIQHSYRRLTTFMVGIVLAGAVGCANPVGPVASDAGQVADGGGSTQANLLVGRWTLSEGDRSIDWEFRNDGTAEREEWLANVRIDLDTFDHWELIEDGKDPLLQVMVQGYDGSLYFDVGARALMDGEDGVIKEYDRLF